jgi:type I restriction enzyme, S subunit
MSKPDKVTSALTKLLDNADPAVVVTAAGKLTDLRIAKISADKNEQKVGPLRAEILELKKKLATAEEALPAVTTERDTLLTEVSALREQAAKVAPLETELADLRTNFDSKVADMREDLVAESQEYCWKAERAENAAKDKMAEAQRQFGITDIQDGRVDWAKVPYVAASGATNGDLKLKRGDIVIARIGATTGKAFLIDDCPDALFASYLIRIRTKPGTSPEFLNFYFQSDQYWNQINQSKGGRLKGGVNIPILESLSLPLPPLAEQRAIAHVLQTVQRAKEARQRELTLERERKAALMRHLFEFGISGEGRTVEERPHGRSPSDWDVRLLDKCAFIQTGIAKGRRLNGAEVITVPYLRVANVQNGFLDLEEMKEIVIRKSELARYELSDGDVVLTEGGDFDKLGRGFVWNGQIAPCVHQNHIFAVRPNRDMVQPDFLAYLVQSPYGRSYFLSVAHKTTNLACINKTKLGRFPVIVPTLDEQQRITNVLKACDAKISAQEREVARLQELFDALLQELLSGKRNVIPLISEDAQA